MWTSEKRTVPNFSKYFRRHAVAGERDTEWYTFVLRCLLTYLQTPSSGDGSRTDQLQPSEFPLPCCCCCFTFCSRVQSSTRGFLKDTPICCDTGIASNYAKTTNNFEFFLTMAASSRSRRLLKLGLATAAVVTAGGGYEYVKDTPWWSSLAPVRFGRAAIAVSYTCQSQNLQKIDQHLHRCW